IFQGMRPSEMPSDRLLRFDKYNGQLASTMSYCMSHTEDQFNRLMFAMSELLCHGMEASRDRKPFTWHNSMALEASFEILNKVTKPPTDRPHEMLLIKFATAFVPFMEELGGYHYLPAPPARPNERQSPLRMMPPPATTDKTGEEAEMDLYRQNYKHIAAEKARAEQKRRMSRMKTNEKTSNLAKIKDALQLSAPFVSKKSALRPVPHRNAALYIGLRDAVMPQSSQASASTWNMGGTGPFESTLNGFGDEQEPMACSRLPKEEEGTGWLGATVSIKEEQSGVEIDPFQLEKPTDDRIETDGNQFEDLQGEVKEEVDDGYLVEVKEELMEHEYYDDEIEKPIEPPIEDRIVIRSTREEEEEAELEALRFANGAHAREPLWFESLVPLPNRKVGRPRKNPEKKPAAKSSKPVAKRREMRLSTFAKHHFPEMIKTIAEQTPSTSTYNTRQKKNEATPIPAPTYTFVPATPKMVPKAHINPCQYCGIDCVSMKMEQHVKTHHKDHWLRFVKKCPEKDCDFRSDDNEAIDAHHDEVHDEQYFSWKKNIKDNRFKLSTVVDGVKKYAQKCPRCNEQLSTLAHYVSHMQLFHKRLCSYDNPILKCARTSCDFEAARCHEIFEHWKTSPTCSGVVIDAKELNDLYNADAYRKKLEFEKDSGRTDSPCMPSSFYDESQPGPSS
ncbi:hypothetical protein PRIPAC_95632, partial [Pristionchus pacificus]